MQKIQWFPGHMHRARKELAAVFTGVDMVLELLDARIPFSSANPMLRELRGEKPCVKLLTKSDLADPEVLAQWEDYYRDEGEFVRAVTTNRPAALKAIPGACRDAYRASGGRRDRLVLMVAGIPNVGKSTLINRLAGRTIAKTGNEAAVTRHQQRIELDADMVLLDTPGVLWPNVENRYSGYRLAATGAIRDTALSLVEVAMYLAAYLATSYPDSLTGRYGLEDFDADPQSLLESIGRARGCLRSGGRVDLERAGRILLSEYRSGVLGQACLETPAMIPAELAEVEAERERKAARKRERKANFRKSASR